MKCARWSCHRSVVPVLVMAIATFSHLDRFDKDHVAFWIWIVLMGPGIGSLVYIALNIVPDIFGGTTARNLSKAAISRAISGSDFFNPL